MRVLSLFSGVGGFDMGLEAAGMTTVFQCEIDKHARSVLDHHWPDVPKWDDVSTLTGAHILEATGGVDLVAWGSPCQDLSLAGKRAGLSGERSGLFHEGIRIIKELRELSNGKYPTWSVWENVVGALSSNGGADFGEVLNEMDEAGACFSEWTVLDAQYFGVPQRRRRVFVTSCFDFATSESCGSPLFPVCESVSGDSAKGSKKGKAVAGEVAEGFGNSGFTTWRPLDQAVTLASPDYKSPNTVVVEPATTAIVEPTPIQDGREIEKHQNGFGVGKEGDPMYTLDQTGGQAVAYAIQGTIIGRSDTAGPQGRGVSEDGEPMYTLDRVSMHAVGHEVQAISYDGYNQTVEEEIHRSWRIGRDSSDFIADLREPTLIVRRLTPLECERLMGWPDNHTATGTNGPVSDTNRYKMCGNGVASPVAQWLATHILATRPDTN